MFDIAGTVLAMLSASSLHFREVGKSCCGVLDVVKGPKAKATFVLDFRKDFDKWTETFDTCQLAFWDYERAMFAV